MSITIEELYNALEKAIDCEKTNAKNEVFFLDKRWHNGVKVLKQITDVRVDSDGDIILDRKLMKKADRIILSAFNLYL